MKQYLFLFMFFLFSSFLGFAEPFFIGIVNPYLIQSTTETFLIKSNLVFEIYNANDEKKFLLKNLNPKGNDFKEVQRNAFSLAMEEECQYVFLFKTYRLFEDIVVQVYLFSIDEQKSLYVRNFPIKFDVKINESIAIVATQILEDISKIEMKPKKTLTVIEKRGEPSADGDDPKSRIENKFGKEKLRHEIFVLNGFLKTNSQTLSLTSLYTGYCFYASDFLYMDVGGEFGIGKQEKWFDFQNWNWNSIWWGGFAGVHFYLKGWIEPNLGAKIEILYYNSGNLFLTIPFELGMKVYVSKHQVVRISGVFPIVSLNLSNYQWDDQLVLGVLIGYGFKL